MKRSTDWESRYLAGDTPWDKGMAAPPLDEIAPEYFAGAVLVPGCGLGHDVRKISRPDNQIIGLDLSQSAVDQASKLPRTSREEYVCGNLFDLPGDVAGRFDAVFEHTCFCAIDPADRSRYVESVAGTLKPGGWLVAIFYLYPGDNDEPPFAVSEAELDELFGQKFQLLDQWVPQVSFPGREQLEQVRIYQLL